MHYFVDGYNLLFHLSDDPQSLEYERNQLIEALNFSARKFHLQITVIFDAISQGEFSRSHFHELEIIFTSKGESADEYILDALNYTNSPRNITVVTSDKGLARLSRNLGAQTKSIESFIKWLNKKESKQKKEIYSTSKDPFIRKELETLHGKDIEKKDNSSLPKKSQEEILPSIRTNASPFELFDYYLSVFERNYQKNKNPPK